MANKLKTEVEFLKFICPGEYIEGKNEICASEQWIRDRIKDRLKEIIQGCGKDECGILKGYYPNGDTWYCDECQEELDALVSGGAE
jgi:hypothetical protein